VIARSKQIIANARTRVETHARLEGLRCFLERLSAREIGIVAAFWRGAQNPVVGRVAAFISWLGNGLIYALFALVLVLFVDGSGWPVEVAVVAAVVAHVLYPWIKLAFARERPFVLRPELVPLIPTLDRLSFPSGHIMTLSAAFVPIFTGMPQLWPSALVIWPAMAWSRIACAHHYPSDVLAGTALGIIVASPITWLLLPLN
jgi:undecaprenyl-diphosphatase